jgi:hypothetical protein
MFQTERDEIKEEKTQIMGGYSSRIAEPRSIGVAKKLEQSAFNNDY